VLGNEDVEVSDDDIRYERDMRELIYLKNEWSQVDP
jgi:hypothetical protein